MYPPVPQPEPPVLLHDLVASQLPANVVSFRARHRKTMGRTWPMSAFRTRAALTVIACAIADPASAQLIAHKDLSYAVANTIAETAMASCTGKGYAISVVVVGRAGETLVALHGDNTCPHTMENARRKAYTALTFRQSTTAYAQKFADNDPVVRQQVTLPDVIAIPGGLPIKLGDDVIAGAVVSGTPGVAEPCVHARLDRVPDHLSKTRRQA